MRHLGRILVTVSLLVLPTTLAAQGSVTGRVTDAQTGAPLVAVQVFVQGTNLGSLTNDEGRYLILNVPVGDRRISAVLLGYGPETQTVTVTPEQAATADFELSTSAIALDEVVVTATGEQRKIELANALGDIQAEAIVETAPITNLSDLLKGRASGVIVGSASGTTGMGNRVRIRGSSSISLSNQPLVYVDGIRVDSDPGSISIGTGGQDISRLDDINPEDIESIEIVKGPSAATLYGTEAANGVIRITTKRGRSGETRWNLWTEYGIVEDENDYPLNYRGLDANNPDEDFVENCRTTHVAAGLCSQTGVAAYTPLYDDELTPLGTGQRRQYGASVGGGAGGVTYFISGEWEEEQGPLSTPAFYFDDLADAGVDVDEDITNPNRFERQSVRANLTTQVGDNATAGIRFGYVSAKRRFPINDNSAGGLFPSAFFGGAFEDRPGNAWGFFNPSQVFGQDNQQNIQRFTTALSGTYNPLTWLTARVSGGLDFSSRHDFSHEPPFLESSNDLGNRSADFTEIYNWTLDVSGTSTFELTPDVGSRTTLGFQYFRDLFHGTRGNANELVPGSETLSTGATTTASELTTENKTVGVFVEQVFSLRDRLFVTGALRADDNSAFGQDFDLIWYPKAGVSWVASDEDFFPQVEWLSLLRLRGAWGASGRQPDSDDAIRTLDVDAIVDPDDQIVNGVMLGEAGNQLLKPERSDEIELGFDADLFEGRAGVDFTWFRRVTSDIIVSEPLPPSLGSDNSRLQNLGEAETSGFELGVHGTILDRDGFTWDMSFNGSLVDSHLNELGLEGVDFLGSQVRHMPGHPLGSMFDFAYTYSDANGDGIIDVNELKVQCGLDDECTAEDMVFLGAGLPEREFSVTTTMHIGSWLRVYALVDHQGNYIAFNNTEGFRCQFRTCRAMQDVTAPLPDQARMIAREEASQSTEWGYMEDGDFYKLREVSVTLFAPEDWAQRIRSNRLSLTLSGRNLVTWTDYTGIDPEINSAGSSDNFGTSEFLTQGIPRYLTARVNVTF